jgi:4-alpha-glucanotransferase
MQALGRLWSRFGGDPAFDRYCHEQGDALRQFANLLRTGRALSRGWRGVARQYRRPQCPAVTRFVAERRPIRLHQWLQWLLDVQLARAAAELPVMQDLPIGVAPNGADAWPGRTCSPPK